MSEFKVKIPTLAEIQASDQNPEEVAQRIGEFTIRFHQTHNGQPVDVYRLVTQLNHSRPWDVLRGLDGDYPDPYRNDPLDVAKIQKFSPQEAQGWAKRYFSPEELQQLLQLSADSAVLDFSKARPKTVDFGYTTLFSHLLTKGEDSMFNGAVSPEGAQTIVNMAWWEMLPLISESADYPVLVVDEILSGKYGAVSADWAFVGTNRVARDPYFYLGRFELSALSNQAINSYSRYVQEMSIRREQLCIIDRELERLVGPLVKVIVSTNPDSSIARFPKGRAGSFAARLRQPWLKGFLTDSDGVRESLIDGLEEVEYELNSGGDYKLRGHIDQVIEALPEVVKIEAKRALPSVYGGIEIAADLMVSK